ncbi:MAG: aminotransferase class I/II-fold pyridoxal phosphate-dependent enzyme [Thermoleophilia bacterium]
MDVTELIHTEAPLVEAMRVYRARDTAAFHTPGHKLGAGAPADLIEALGERLFSTDIAIAGGLDDTQGSGGLLRRAEELAAQAWGAERAFFTANGSSGGLQALVMAVAGPGDEVVVPRNAHKALLAGLILSGARPVWVEPIIDEIWQIAVNVPLAAYATAIAAHPRAGAVFVTSPSYNGFCADIAELATMAHAAGMALVVDQAWGAHLRFSSTLPLDAMAAGADAAVISVHKLLAALSQASVVLAQGARIDADRLRTMVTMLCTTSPLAPVYLSIDAARRQMVEGGEALWDEALRLATLARDRLSVIPGVTVLDRQDALRPGSVDFDPVRLTISAAGLGLSGYELERLLRADHAIAVEAADPHNIVANITFGDSETTVDRLVVALEAIAADRAESSKGAVIAAPRLPRFTRLACSPREAFFGPSEALPLRACIGRTSAEMVVPYPPGIPVLGPGEEISAETVDYLTEAAGGVFVHGPRDLALATLLVVSRES